MFFTDLLEEESLQVSVGGRRTGQRGKPPRRYSPRFEKQRAPSGARNGIHRRGSKRSHNN